jgi:hypothetical protein
LGLALKFRDWTLVVLALSMSPEEEKTRKDKERSVDPKKETASWAAAPIADVSAKDSLFRNRAEICSAPKEPIGAPAMAYYVQTHHGEVA